MNLFGRIHEISIISRQYHLCSLQNTTKLSVNGIFLKLNTWFRVKDKANIFESFFKGFYQKSSYGTTKVYSKGLIECKTNHLKPNLIVRLRS